MIYGLTSTDAHFVWACTQFRCCMLYTASYASFVIESPNNILRSDTDVIQTQVRRHYILYSLFGGCICISTTYIYIYCWSAEISVAMATVALVVGRTRKETNSAPPFWNRYSRRVSWQLCCNSRLLPASRSNGPDFPVLRPKEHVLAGRRGILLHVSVCAAFLTSPSYFD